MDARMQRIRKMKKLNGSNEMNWIWRMIQYERCDLIKEDETNM